MANLLKKMQEKENFSEAERVIADYLMEHYREIGNFTTRQLAKATFTNSATIVRFSQKMGFEGYVDFKVHFLAEMMQHVSEPRESYLKEKDKIPVILDKIMYMGLNAIKESHAMLEPALVVRAMSILSQVEHIDFYAMGLNIYPIHMITESFFMNGKTSAVYDALTTQYIQAYNAPKNHLGFLVSRTGENRHLLEVAKCLKLKGNPLMLITAKPKSSLGTLSDVVFPAYTADTVTDGGPRLFQLSTMYILHVLWAAMMTKDDIKKQIRQEAWIKKHLHY